MRSYGGTEPEFWDLSVVCDGEGPASIPAILGDDCRPPSSLAVLTEAFRRNPRVKDPKKMASHALKTCRVYAYNRNGRFDPDEFEELVSVVAVAAVVGKGMSARQAIEDYRAGKYPGPDGQYVFGVALREVIPKGFVEDEEGDEVPITADMIGDWDRSGQAYQGAAIK